MTVYVDELQSNVVNSANFPFKKFCHMTADTFEELHAMADKIGLQRDWFQPDDIHPHYDLTSSKRGLALQSGAVFLAAKTQAKRRSAGWRTAKKSTPTA